MTEEQLLEHVRERAENLFRSQAMLCAEAVIYTLNEAFDGPLTPDEAIQLGSPFCVGMGGAGCTCGALTGAVASAGLFMGRKTLGKSGGPIRSDAHEMHDAFRETFGSTCCRVLTKNVKHDKSAHFAQCAKFTGYAAEMAAKRIIAKRGMSADTAFLQKRNTRLGTWLYRLRALFA